LIGFRVTRRYAKALFHLAREQKVLEQVESDMANVREIAEESPEFSVLLQSPIIQVQEKRQIISEIFKGKIHQLSYDFLNLLLDKNREDLLSGIITHFLEYIDELRGILRGDLRAAYPLSDQQKESLKDQLDRITGKNVIINEQIDSTLIGGFVIKMEDTVIDASIKNQLNKLRETLLLTQ
jgi:F-type H+-transporting ATPase subunit delta